MTPAATLRLPLIPTLSNQNRMNAFEVVILCVSAVAVVALCGFLGALKALMRERSRSAGLDRDLAAAHERTRQLEA
ncbi:MAG TPA: hypothetical protein VHX64_11840, partial [Caulobacteraceae bacterium]|nr:hypothetical protein [Caulobacteraceae bacterium]